MTALPKYLHSDLTRGVVVPFGSTPATRAAALLLAVVAQLFVELAERYRKRDIDGNGTLETCCNFFAQDASAALGVPLPRLRANSIILWLMADGLKQGWEQVPEHVAQAMAEQGQVVFACWYNRNGASGHIALVVPSLGEPGTWIAQAGARNFSRGLLESGFGTAPVTFFAHP